MKLALMAMMAAVAFAQVDLYRPPCGLSWPVPATAIAPPGTGRVVLYIPSPRIAGGRPTASPACATLGPGLKITGDERGWVLDSVALPQPQPRMVIERSWLAPHTGEVDRFTFKLKHFPATNTAILVFYRSSAAGFDATEVVMASNSKDLEVVLPVLRPFRGSDEIRVVYWTSEPETP